MGNCISSCLCIFFGGWGGGETAVHSQLHEKKTEFVHCILWAALTSSQKEQEKIPNFMKVSINSDLRPLTGDCSLSLSLWATFVKWEESAFSPFSLHVNPCFAFFHYVPVD